MNRTDPLAPPPRRAHLRGSCGGGTPLGVHRRRSLALGAALAGAFALAACSVGPRYELPGRNVPEAWGTTTGVTTEGTNTDLAAWWGTLDDPALSSLIEDAMSSNRDLRAAEARLRASRSRETIADAGRRPSVAGTGSSGASVSTFEQGNNPSTRTALGFDAAWELDVFRGVEHRVQAAVADSNVAQAQLAGVRVSIAAEVARNYVDVRQQQARLRNVRASLGVQSEVLELAEHRAQAGLSTQLDVERASSNLEHTRAQLPIIETALTRAEYQIDVLIGALPGSVHMRLADEIALPQLPSQIAVGIPADVLRQRPDVRAAEYCVMAETARAGVAEAALYPSFRLSGSIGLELVSRGASGPAPGVVSSLLAGITAPLLGGGRLRAQRDVQSAVRDQSLIAYEQAVLQALHDVEGALVALAHHEERVAAVQDALIAADAAVSLSAMLFETGVSDFEVMLATERDRLTLQDALAGAHADGLLALIQLYKALGGGWEPGSTQIQIEEDIP